MSVLRDGASIAVEDSKAGTGYIEYDAVVVSTIRNANRGFDNAMYVEISLLSDFAGAAAAVRDNVDEASGGRGISTVSDSIVAAFNLLRRRCGGSSIEAALPSVMVGLLASETGLSLLGMPAFFTLFLSWRLPPFSLLKALAQKKVLSTLSSLDTADCCLCAVGK